MAFDQTALNPITLTVEVDAASLFADQLRQLGSDAADIVDEAVWGFADTILGHVGENIGTAPGEGDILHFMTGGLWGSFRGQPIKTRSKAVLESDVFYGVLWESEMQWIPPRPWFQPAIDEAGGQKGLEEAVERSLAKGIRERGLG